MDDEADAGFAPALDDDAAVIFGLSVDDGLCLLTARP